MKILAIADEECDALWEYYRPGKLKEYDLILSCGDLNSSYLSFLVTMGRAPLLYVHGNHDTGYSSRPPEGCDCIDDRLIIWNGLRILGLGGCRRYRPGPHQYTDREMAQRIRKLKLDILMAGGVDIVVTHAPPLGLGDGEDLPHLGFESLLKFIERYQPRYLLHGHIHRRYSTGAPRILRHADTQIINCCERFELDVEPDTKKISIAGKIARFFWRKRLNLY